MAKVKLKSDAQNWVGTLPGGDLRAVAAGEVIDVSDEQAAYLVSEDCSGAFEASKPEKAKKD